MNTSSTTLQTSIPSEISDVHFTSSSQKLVADILARAHELFSENLFEELKSYLLAEQEDQLVTWHIKDRFDYNWLLAEALYATDDLNQAYKFAQEGLDLASGLSNNIQSKANYQIAKFYGDLGLSQDCFHHVLLAYELADEKDPILINGIAVQYARRKNFDESDKWYSRGLKVCEGLVDETSLRSKAILLHNLAESHLNRSNYQKAVEYYSQSLELIPASQKVIKIRIEYNLAACLTYVNEVEKAKKHFQAAADLEASVRQTRCIENKVVYGKILLVEGNLEEAEAVVLESLERVKHEESAVWMPQIYEMLTKIYETQGEFQKALEVSKRHRKVLVERSNIDFDRRMNFMLSKFEHDKVSQEREFYRKQSQMLAENLTAVQAQAQIDALTKVYNRAYFDYISGVMFESLQKTSQPFCLLMIDLDKFKNVNDTFGHLTGDAVLKDAAKLMQSCLRKEDVLARYGGEEFSILLPNTFEQDALAVAEKLRLVIQDYAWTELAEGLKVTSSIGVFECVRSLEFSLDQADKRLYLAKENGRNCVVGS